MLIFYCNSCLCKLLAPGDEQSPNSSKGYLANCGHIFCTKCAPKSKQKCSQCRRPTHKFTAIDKNMAPKTRMCFEPLENSLKQVCTAIKFQEHQMDVHYKQMSKEHSKLKGIGRELKQNVMEMNDKNKAMEEEIKKMLVIHQKVKEAKNRQSQDQQPAKRFKRSPSQILAQKSPVKRKFIMRPSQYKDARPLSPRRLRVASFTETILFNPAENDQPTINPTTNHVQPTCKSDVSTT
ncbi:zip homologous protein 2-like [Sitodiplosis mosellana]|uniref:zip homologous protein 2-like n=1 Tax=Sitodiplosis mosellana TaxID=263140 RepID=UPI002444B3AA|nr:zip homologous protein 2-like [Sitodiplosis mosellana]